jgi:hypothetical protein
MVSFSASVFKEIQCLLFFVCNELYYAKDSMREEAGNNFLAKKFFGDPTDPDSTGMVKIFVTGDDYFSEVFISEFVTMNCITKPKNVFNPKLTCMLGITIYVGNNAGDFNGALLSRKSMSKDEGMVNGLYIRDQMVTVMSSLKKATSYCLEYLDSKGNGPSGGNEHDYHKYVLNKMYVEWHVQCQKDKVTRDKVARKKNGIPEPPGSELILVEQVIAMERPEQWIFPDFMAFVLFGH